MQQVIELLELESGIIAKNTAAIATVSFFEGDLSEAYTYIKERFAGIVQANPWLGGSLSKGFMAKRVHLTYDEIDVETLVFLNPEGLSIHTGLPYADITTSVELIMDQSTVGKRTYLLFDSICLDLFQY